MGARSRRSAVADLSAQLQAVAAHADLADERARFALAAERAGGAARRLPSHSVNDTGVADVHIGPGNQLGDLARRTLARCAHGVAPDPARLPHALPPGAA